MNVPNMQDLLGAGVHFGHKVARGNPKMKRYIYGARDGVHIIDLAQSEQKLQEATQKAYELGKEGKVMLIVGTKKQAQDVVKEWAEKSGAFYMNVRWFGGLLTNFDEMRRNVKKILSLKEGLEKGQLAHYTKREQLLLSRKIDKFNLELGGVAAMDAIPDVMFIIDAMSDKTAITEANKIGMMVLGICDTNADPNWFDYPVPANDDGIKAIRIICDTILAAYLKGKEESNKQAEEATKRAADEAKKAIESVELVGAVAEETAALEEVIEKATVEDSERKVA